MDIGAKDAAEFPELAAIVRNLAIRVARKPRVLAAFRRYAGDGADLALFFGQLPRVRIDPDFFRCEDDGDPRVQRDGSVVQPQNEAWLYASFAESRRNLRGA